MSVAVSLDGSVLAGTEVLGVGLDDVPGDINKVGLLALAGSDGQGGVV